MEHHRSQSTVCSQLPTVPWLHVAVRRQQRAEAKQRQVHSRAALLHLGPALSGAPGGRGWRGQVGVHRARVAAVMAAIVVGVRGRDAAAAAAANQEHPPVVTVVQQAGRRQQHQDEGAEQEEKHVDAFSLSRQACAATCRQTTGSQQLSTARI